jgi:uncharacterized membrane protein YdjX (TVP38/TMEM64 family)
MYSGSPGFQVPRLIREAGLGRQCEHVGANNTILAPEPPQKTVNSLRRCSRLCHDRALLFLLLQAAMAPPDQARSSAMRRFMPLAAIVLVAGVVIAMGWHRQLSFETLERHHAVIHDFVDRHTATAVGGYVALYIVIVALSLPGAVFLTLAGGMLFGLVVGGLAAALGATVGAICIFLVAKSAFGERLIRRAGPLAAKLADGFCADAFNYLLFLRLIPLFPFWLVNLVPAVAGVRLKTFVAATAIGILPASFVFAFLGASLENIIAAELASFRTCLATGRADCRLDFNPHGGATLELLAAFGLLGVLALVPVIARRMRARRAIPPG